MPAHFCGVLGLKPTINRMPAAGLVAGSIDLPRLDRTLGVCGPMARSIEDLGLALRLLAGPHPSDPEVPPVPVSTVAALARRSWRSRCRRPSPAFRSPPTCGARSSA